MGFGKYDLAFLTPGFSPPPDYGLNARLAILYYSSTDTQTVHRRGGSTRERSCVTVR